MRPHLPLLVSLSLCPGLALAFNFQTPLTQGCHEPITLRAVQRAGWPDGAAPGAVSDDDRVLAKNLPFSTGGEDDTTTVSLLIGVRENDLHGSALLDLQELNAVHNGAGTQREHCLRAPDDDGAEGDARALQGCRAFMLEQLGLALGEGDAPDFAAREDVTVALKFESARVPVSSYAFHLGRALHALQDGFAHTLRTEDFRQVLGVLNYVDPAVSPHYDERRDGHRHLSAQDHCDGDDEATSRAAAAETASSELIAAVGAPGTRAERLARAAAVIDDRLALKTGCGVDDDWCGSMTPDPVGCSAVGQSAPLALLGLVALTAARARARPRA